MLARHQFVIEQVQASLFLADASAFSSSQAIAAILGRYPERFTGPLVSLPLSDNAPPEIPRVILQSSEGEWRAQFSPARMDAVRSLKAVGGVVNLMEAVADCRDMVVYYMREAAMAVDRMALIVTRRCPVENPAQVLIDRFCNEASRHEPLNRSAAFELHNHKVYTPPDSPPLNSWVRCKCGSHKSEGPVILVVQDLNTVAGDGEVLYTAEAAAAFFSMARSEADSIFDKYFPDIVTL